MKKYTKHEFKYLKGIDDLKSEYFFLGNSQGDGSATNSLVEYNNSGGWMSPIQKHIPDTQKEINTIIQENKEWNKNYIKQLQEEGKFGEIYNIDVQIECNPDFDKVPKYNHSTESYRFEILDMSQI
jgi:hypothetical protein